ncbi:unnamed protein product [Brassica napus]|uniref:(rape) hypothetical protein n=1 Tax=Brassica napus TaxID=3708 RepID=A0A816XYN7_BRANA|nr:unnamed protein product [Brassica napus]
MGSTHCSTSMFSLRETLFSFLGNKLQRRSEMNLLQNPSDSGRGVDGSEEDVGHLRQVKKLKTSDNMEVDLTQIPTVEASDREKKDTSGLAISESPTAGSSSKGNLNSHAQNLTIKFFRFLCFYVQIMFLFIIQIDSCLLNTIYCNDPDLATQMKS